MALTITFPDDRGDPATYWMIDRLQYDKATGNTAIFLAGFPTEAVRTAKFPVAYGRKQYTAPGVFTQATAYAYLLTLPEFAGATAN